MLLIRGASVRDPRHGEGLMADIWQLALSTTIGLYMLGMGEREHVLGIASPNRSVEKTAADMVARDTQGSVEDGSLVPGQIMADPRVAARHLVPAWRNFRTNSQSFGWQRTDPLITTYGTLTSISPGCIAGSAVVFRPLPGMKAATVLTTFASGPGADELSYELASSFAWVGVKVLQPMNQRRFARRALGVQVSTALSFIRPDCVLGADELSAFWHPSIKTGSEGGR